jgi:hypothetical protein
VSEGHQRPYTDEERASWPYGEPPALPTGISSGIKAGREASMNAVIIQIAYGKRYVSIECMDEEMLPKLNEVARRITQSVDISDIA